MSTTGLHVFDATVHKTNVWLKDLMETLNWTDRHKAYRGLRATIHALRDRLTVEEAAHFAAQLPMLVRGFYYEGWDPTGKPLRERHVEEFLEQIRREFRRDESVDPEQVARAVFSVFGHRISPGEVEDVKQVMPGEIRQLWQ